MAEEGSESARQAPVFYEGDSPDGKYAGANEKCRPRSPGNEIPGTARVDSGNYRLYPHERSFATAVSLGTVLSAIADLTGYGRRDIINPGKAVIYVSWKENFMKSFDMTYKLVNAKTRNLKYPCYGGRFSWFLVSRHFENLYFYLTQNSLVYTAGGTYITEIPFDSIKKLSIKRGLFAKSSIHIRIVADKRYHLLLKDMKWLSTRRTGNNEDNIRGFVETLQSNVMTNK